MKTKIIGLTIAVFLGIFFGLMFIAIQQSLIFSRQMVRQQVEMIDLLRTLVEDNKEIKLSLADVGKAVKNLPVPARFQQPAAPQEDFDKVHPITYEGSAVRGDARAPVTIVGFIDLQCPFSKRFQPVINELLKKYPGKVRYIVKHFPLKFHPQAVPAAKAVLAAGEQGKYWEMFDMVLENNNQLTDASYEEFAKKLGLNVKKFNGDLKKNNESWNKLIKDNFDLGIASEVRGTPTFYINGRKMPPPPSVEGYAKRVEELLNK
ncbi:MAG: thioredoxin domain-containing protein [Candidatus Omnitrophota bacterium]